MNDKVAALQAAVASGDMQTDSWIVKSIQQEAVRDENEKHMNEIRKLVLQQGALQKTTRPELTEPPPPKPNDISRIYS
jgi:hypothetical protein